MLDVIFKPTPDDCIEKMLDMTQVRPGETVHDLGCGDGRILVAAAKRGATAVGWEIDPALVKRARLRAEKQRVRDLVAVHEGDLFDVDLSGTDVVTLFLSPKDNVRLWPQLAKLKPGARIVSHSFGIQDVPAIREETVEVCDKKTGEVLHTAKVSLWVAPLPTPPMLPMAFGDDGCTTPDTAPQKSKRRQRAKGPHDDSQERIAALEKKLAEVCDRLGVPFAT